MKKLKLALLLFYVPVIIFAQDDEKYTIETNTGETKVVEVFRVTADKIWYWDENENKAFYLKSELKSYRQSTDKEFITVKKTEKPKPQKQNITPEKPKDYYSAYIYLNINSLLNYKYISQLQEYTINDGSAMILNLGITPKIHLVKGFYLTAGANYMLSQSLDITNNNSNEPDIDYEYSYNWKNNPGVTFEKGPYLAKHTSSDYSNWNFSVGLEKYFEKQFSIYAKGIMYKESYKIQTYKSTWTYIFDDARSTVNTYYYEYFYSTDNDYQTEIKKQTYYSWEAGFDFHFIFIPISVGASINNNPRGTIYSVNIATYLHTR